MKLAVHTSWALICAVCIGTSAAILANLISFIMIGRINQRVPERDRISHFWWGTEVRKRFKELYPRNKLVLLLDSCLAMMIICFVLMIRFWVF